MHSNRVAYRSYLLRLWWDTIGHTWRVSLQSTATEHTVDFATVEALLAFLLEARDERAEDDCGQSQRP